MTLGMIRALHTTTAALLALSCAGRPLDRSAMPEAPRAALNDVDTGGATASGASAGSDAGTAGNVVLSGTPAIAAELRQRLSQYMNTRSASLEHVSDDGKRVVVTTRFAETTQAHIIEAPLGSRMQLTFEDEPVGRVRLSHDGKALLYMTDVGGNEQYQIRRMELQSGRSALLTDGKSRHGDYVVSSDGKLIAYTGNARNGRDMDLYLGDGRDQAGGKLLLERAGHWYPLEFSRDGKQLLVGEYVSINDSRLYLVDLSSREVRSLTPESPRASYRAAALHPAGDRLYLATDRDGEFVELYEVRLDKDAAWKPLSRSIPWNIEEVKLSPDGRTLAFVSNEDGYGVLHLLDTATGQSRKAPGMPKGVVRGIRFASGRNILGFTLEGATVNGDAFTLDLATNRVTRFTKSEVGGLDSATFVEPSLIRYPASDGRKIPSFYYRPSTTGPHPVVVWIHGGPEAQSRPLFSSLIQYLVVESKMAVLVPNVRGSDGYGKSYLLMDNGKKREDSVKDIGALLDWAKDQSEIDASRAAVVGGSYGGYMVLASLIHFGDRLRAGVNVVGISNFVTFLENTQEYRRDLRRAEYGDERDPEMRKFLTAISPTTNAQKIRSALFVAHGANDPRVPLSETDQIVDAVRKNDKDVWYMVAKNEGHGFRRKENRDLFTMLTVAFLEEHLKKP